MTKIPFQKHHLIGALKSHERDTTPLDLHLSNYFRRQKQLGSKDRAFIAKNSHRIEKWRLLFEYLAGSSRTEDLVELSCESNLSPYLQDNSIPPHIRASAPECLFKLIEKEMGTHKALEFFFISNEEAPLTIRTNTLKIAPSELFERFKERFSPTMHPSLEECMTFAKREPLLTTEEYKQGFFEIQDASSQLSVKELPLQEKSLVLDYCAGSGGKSLALAPRLGGTGQIFLHDIREKKLLEAKQRLRRAGVQNSQIKAPGVRSLNLLKKKMDLVLVDVPCSGTGTLRRNVFMKWRFSENYLAELLELQRKIFETALQFVKPQGFICYLTCSVLEQENEKQVASFLNSFPIKLVKPPLKIPLQQNGPDGFFTAVFQKT